MAGGRGKGHFDSGLKGGVKMCYEPSQVRKFAEQMLGSNLITKQTGAGGRPCNEVFIVERVYVRKEYYFAILNDRKTQGPVIIASSEGGMDIETVAHETPEKIVTFPIDINTGLAYADAINIAKKVGFTGDAIEKV